MSDALSFAEIYGQHVELLPARTVLSMFVTADDPSAGGSGGSSSGDPVSAVVTSVMSGLTPKLP
ncbi:MAG: hypothetical protein H0V41_10790 [Pseudonocardiales bacterium]|nr:hypothetical protein [Pseudonocardiales bacterium]